MHVRMYLNCFSVRSLSSSRVISIRRSPKVNSASFGYVYYTFMTSKPVRYIYIRNLYYTSRAHFRLSLVSFREKGIKMGFWILVWKR